MAKTNTFLTFYQIVECAGAPGDSQSWCELRCDYGGFWDDRIQHVTLGSGHPFWGGQSRQNRRNRPPLCTSTARAFCNDAPRNFLHHTPHGFLRRLCFFHGPRALFSRLPRPFSAGYRNFFGPMRLGAPHYNMVRTPTQVSETVPDVPGAPMRIRTGVAVRTRIRGL